MPRHFLHFLLLFVPFVAALAAADLDDRPVVNDSGVRPEQPASGTLPTLWIAGDSTVNIKAPMRGWGQDLPRFFDSAKINIVNRAIGGRSSRTFYTEKRWQGVVDQLKPGDWVLIQFGHNDVGDPGPSSKYRGSVKGIGEETQDVTGSDGTVETVHTYGWYLKAMVRSAREKGANVVLCSPIPHKSFDADGRPRRDWRDWRGWVAECAKTEGAYYVDLCELIGRAYDRLPRADIEGMFADKGTHTNATGSLFNAKALVTGLRALPGTPLDFALSTEGRALSPAR